MFSNLQKVILFFKLYNVLDLTVTMITLLNALGSCNAKWALNKSSIFIGQQLFYKS